MKKTIAIAAGVLVLASCSGEPSAAPTPSMSPAATPTSSPTPSPTPSPSPTPMVGNIGDTYVGNAVDITVEDHNPRVTTSGGNKTWQAVLVKTCAKQDGVGVSTMPWAMIGEDSGRYGDASEHYGDAPKPLYPVIPEELPNGECVRGWILFDADASVKVKEVRYAGESEALTRWRLGA